MDGFEWWYAVLFYEYKMKLFINDDMLRLMIITTFDFIDDNFTFLREKDLNLFLAKIRPFE